MTVTFLDGNGDVLASVVIGPVTAADPNGLTGLLLREASGRVPAGTRTIEVQLAMVRDAPPEFTYNDGSVDDVRLVLFP